MADYLWRLLVVLPLILLGVVGVLLVLHHRRGGQPGGLLAAFSRGPGTAPAAEPLVLRMQALTPAARVAVLRFAGRDHLVGLSGDAMLLIASSDAPAASGPVSGPASGPVLKKVAP